MNLCEKLAADCDDECVNLSFSETLDAYLDLRAAGPDERDGYTDKAHHYMAAALRRHMDDLTRRIV